ncbi:MAG: DUF4352 domain-containing protein [Actinomycetota bacterium]
MPTDHQPTRTTPWRHLVVLALVAVVGLSACRTNEAALVNDDGTSTAQTDFAIGDRVALGDLEYMIHTVTDPFDNGRGVGEPRAGNRWVAVDLEVYNIGTEPFDLVPVTCFDVQDGLNRTFDQEFWVETDVARPSGEIAPGASRRGLVVWELPADATGLRMNAKCELFSRGSATFRLG